MVGVQTKNDELSQDHSNFSPFWVDHFSRMWIFVVAWWSLEKQNQQKLHITKAYAGEVWIFTLQKGLKLTTNFDMSIYIFIYIYILSHPFSSTERVYDGFLSPNDGVAALSAMEHHRFFSMGEIHLWIIYD